MIRQITAPNKAFILGYYTVLDFSTVKDVESFTVGNTKFFRLGVQELITKLSKFYPAYRN